jgi:hypothetical protein
VRETATDPRPSCLVRLSLSLSLFLSPALSLPLSVLPSLCIAYRMRKLVQGLRFRSFSVWSDVSGESRVSFAKGCLGSRFLGLPPFVFRGPGLRNVFHQQASGRGVGLRWLSLLAISLCGHPAHTWARGGEGVRKIGYILSYNRRSQASAQRRHAQQAA